MSSLTGLLGGCGGKICACRIFGRECEEGVSSFYCDNLRCTDLSHLKFMFKIKIKKNDLQFRLA